MMRQSESKAGRGKPSGAAPHSVVLQAFEKQRTASMLAWDAQGSLWLACALLLTDVLLISLAAHAGATGSLAWAAAVMAMGLLMWLLLALPALALRLLRPRAAYLRWRTPLILLSRTLALVILDYRAQYARHVMAGADLSLGLLLLIHGARILLCSQVHGLPAGPAALLQLLAVGGGALRAWRGCRALFPFTSPASLALFSATARRLEQYSWAVWAVAGLWFPESNLPAANELVLARPTSSSPSSGGGGGTSSPWPEASMCFPVILWHQLMFGLAVPLAWQLAAERLQRARYLLRHCSCAKCERERESGPAWAVAAGLCLAAVHAPALAWHVIAGTFLQWQA